MIAYKDVTSDELFEVARLVVAAEIAKIHTIEWTPQLLYNEPAYLAMNANWNGLVSKHPLVEAALWTKFWPGWPRRQAIRRRAGILPLPQDPAFSA